MPLLSWLVLSSLALGAAVEARQEPGATAAHAGSSSPSGLLARGEYQDALEELEAAHRAAPAERSTVELYARALLEVGRYQDASEVLDAYLRERPEAVGSLGVLQARSHAARGEDRRAEEILRLTIDSGGPAALSARTELGYLLFDRGEIAAGERLLDSLIDAYNGRNGLSSAELVAVGRAVERLGRNDPQLFKDALKAYDEAAAVDPTSVEPATRVALLFLEKYDAPEARKSLATVLQRNPNHPEALLALARVHRFDGSPEARRLVERVLEINPNLVAARVFKAQILLELEQYEEARVEAERALEVNPRSLEALGVKAASHFLADEPEAFRAARDRVLELNPRAADLYLLLAEACVQNRLYEEAREFAQQAVDLDPKSWQGWGELGLNQLRLGQIEDGRRSLETAFEGDPYNVWNKNTLDLLDTFDQYRLIRHGRFELFVHRDESELLAAYVGDLAEEAYDYLAERYRYEAPTPIRIEVYPSHADFSVRTVGLAGLGALGVSFGPVVAIDSPSARTVGSFNWGTTLWHELAHTFTLGVTDHQIPRWLTEGLSVFEEQAGRTAWGDEINPDFLQALVDDRLLDIAEINDGFVRPSYPGQIGISYLHASLVCELIDREWGFGAIREILDGYRRGLGTEQIFAETLEIDLEEFDRRFFAWLNERFAPALASFEPRKPGAEVMVEGPEEDAPAPRLRPDSEKVEEWAERERDNFRAQYAWGARLHELGRSEEAIPFLERAKTIFPEFATDESPYRLLARIHREAGRVRKAIDELRAMTDVNEYSHRALLELAELYGEVGDDERQADALARSMFIYPMEVEPHRTLATLYEKLGDWRGAATEWRAVGALQPSSRAEAYFRLADALRRAGDPAAARREVLRSLEIAPGYGPAQDLLLELVEGSS